jgi:hypothetical protein
MDDPRDLVLVGVTLPVLYDMGKPAADGTGGAEEVLMASACAPEASRLTRDRCIAIVIPLDRPLWP